MLKAALDDLFRMLRRTAEIRGAGDLTDGQLLDRFLTQRQEGAFSAIVHRHGAMVFSVCHRLLGDTHSAEDCMQATFMVLAQRCAAIRMRRGRVNLLEKLQRTCPKHVEHHTPSPVCKTTAGQSPIPPGPEAIQLCRSNSGTAKL